ncbi:MAG: CPBP family intramembrane glutamic endopeptidase [Cyanobacteria bacterium P01_A01_bin.17]
MIGLVALAQTILMTPNYQSKSFLQLIAVVLVVYIAPIVLMLVDIIPSEFKYHVLIGMSALLLLYGLLNGASLSSFGFTRRNLKPALTRVVPVSALVAAVILALYFLRLFRSDSPSAHWSFYIFYIFVSASLQEFVYRGFLFHLLKKAHVSTVWTIVVSSALYGFMHIIFDIPAVIFTFLIGLFWGWAYEKDRNIYGVMISHSILGSLSLLANFS